MSGSSVNNTNEVGIFALELPGHSNLTRHDRYTLEEPGTDIPWTNVGPIKPMAEQSRQDPLGSTLTLLMWEN